MADRQGVAGAERRPGNEDPLTDAGVVGVARHGDRRL